MKLTHKQLVAKLTEDPRIERTDQGDTIIFSALIRRRRQRLIVWPDGSMMDADVDLAIAKCLTIAQVVKQFDLSA